jgi:ATP-dependent RNA helicase DDX27
MVHVVQAKRAGSKLQNRQVAPAAIAKWRTKIEGMEDDVRAVQQEEREERALRKAEMEANKAQNMMDHEAEIYSRPKREWFQSTRDKRMIAAEAKVEVLPLMGSTVLIR